MKTRQKAKPCENVPPEEPINFEDPDVDIQLPETATVEKVTSFMHFLLKYFYISIGMYIGFMANSYVVTTEGPPVANTLLLPSAWNIHCSVRVKDS